MFGEYTGSLEACLPSILTIYSSFSLNQLIPSFQHTYCTYVLEIKQSL